jgi:hypothetical protein
LLTCALENRLKPLKDKAKPFLSMLKKGEIRVEELSFDEVLYVTREAVVTVESVEKLWRRVREWLKLFSDRPRLLNNKCEN